MSTALPLLQSAVQDIREEIEFWIDENNNLKKEIQDLTSKFNEMKKREHNNETKIEKLLDEIKSLKETTLELRSELFKATCDNNNNVRPNKGLFGRFIS